MGRPMLVITSDATPFDPVISQHWEEEGFQVNIIPFNGGGKSFAKNLKGVSDGLEAGEKYAVVAYGAAAAEVLTIHQQAMPKLCALVAYYPTRLPSSTAPFPPGFLVHAHLTEPISDLYPIPNHIYLDAGIGFAERNTGKYHKISANLAWSRTLGTVRRGFGIDVDLERVWEEHLALEFATKDADATMKTMIPEPYVNHVPTITGGIGAKELHRFYQDFFIPSNPPSMRIHLLSRTIGVDRVVDEMHASFIHTHEIPWMIPGIPPTDKTVEIALVSVVCIRGGKLYHEHIYWDQASVLVQLGLLDPKLGAIGLGKNGVNTLPIVGRDGARKVIDEESVRSNDLIPGWR
ncbi:MAG: hypothetical protein M1837_006099 [Sclerophora amabilis]|nr:MAG: hypothetical protein M1837_006099 [Sclerophora amabilis]